VAGPWYVRSGAAGTGDGLSWTNARTTLTTMTSVVAGDTIYVAHDHAEAPGANLTVTFPGTPANPNIVLCVLNTATHPVASTDWRTTGSVATTGIFSITTAGSAYIYGLTFNAGITAAGICGLTIGLNGNCFQYYDACVLRLSSTTNSASTRITIGATGNGTPSRIVLNNTQMSFNGIAYNLALSQGEIEWRNTGTPFPASVPTTLIAVVSQPILFTFEGIDFSSMVAGKSFIGTINSQYRLNFYGCKFGGGTISPATTSPAAEVYVVGSGLAASTTTSLAQKYALEGTETTDITIIRTGGASDGTVSVSRAYTPAAGALSLRPYAGLPMVKWNDTTGSNVTVTLYGIWNAAALPTNAQIWFETAWHGDATSPLMALQHNSRSNLSAAATNWTTDGSPWDATARANTTPYALGAAIKTSNTGRVFFCTTAGTTAGSEPGGYASATDGSTPVTDGTAAFRAGMRFAMTYTLSAPQPQLKGPVYLTPRIAGTTAAIWLDPEF